jgi:hypothetical protein
VVRRPFAFDQISALTAQQAQDIAVRKQLPVTDVLRSRFSVSHCVVLMAECDILGSRVIDPSLHAPHAPHAALVRRSSAARAITHMVLPWRAARNCTLVLAMTLF